MLAYLHPLTGVVIVALLVYTGSLGLRARSDRRRAQQHLRLHARLGPPMFALVLFAWLGGVVSTWLWRSGLELGASSHMRVGTVLEHQTDKSHVAVSDTPGENFLTSGHDSIRLGTAFNQLPNHRRVTFSDGHSQDVDAIRAECVRIRIRLEKHQCQSRPAFLDRDPQRRPAFVIPLLGMHMDIKQPAGVLPLVESHGFNQCPATRLDTFLRKRT